MPDDHSELVPLLPIPNRTVKRLSANDSADTRVKVGHCQAISQVNPLQICRGFLFCAVDSAKRLYAAGAHPKREVDPIIETNPTVV